MNNTSKQYKSRIIFVFFMLCFFYGIILFNLYVIQIRHNNFFLNLAKKQYQVTITTAPPRAPIFDRSHKFLAMNKESLSAFILPKKCSNPEDLQQFLAQHFPQILERFNLYRERHFMFIKRKLTDHDLAIIKKSNLEDIKLLREPSRYYPVESANTIVGLTDVDNQGLFGIELQYNDHLAGKPTTFSLKKDARSGHFYFKKETKIAGKNGLPVMLTIDSDLQFLVDEELKDTIEKYDAKEGAVLIMDPHTGEILTMVCRPYYDTQSTYNLNLEHTKNKIITESYELGSVIKVFAALAALEEEVVTPDELIDCKNSKTAYLNGRKINTVAAHGNIPFSDVIAFSNNIGIATVAQRLDQKLFDHYTRLGFGKKTNILFPGEQSGFINPPHEWSKQSLISLSYGYEISATLLQLATAFCIIANDGYTVQPKIILEPPHNQHFEKKQLYSGYSIEAIKTILEKTTQHGTARRAGIKGYTIMSKTGTANTLVNGTYVQDKNIFTCAGIVQKDNYKRVIVTFVKESSQKKLFAATVAAPLFERVAEKLLIHDKIL